MATSTPTPVEPAAPREERLVSIAEQVAAIDTLIGLARRSIGVFDVDLSGLGWDGAARTERLVAFLRSSPVATLRIVLHDTGWVERSCPRLTGLLKYYGHAVSIRRTGEEAKHAMDPLVIVDDAHFLHRFHASQPRAAFAVEQPEAAKPLVERFDAIWFSAEPGITATTLGL